MCSAKLTPRKKRRFLEVLVETANVTKAAEAAQLHRRFCYELRAQDAAFAAEWDAALVVYAESILEPEADRRAAEGCVRKKFTRSGEPIIDPETDKQYEEREYSDTLLIFRLKGLKPNTYRDNVKQTVVGPNDGPIEFIEIVTPQGANA
jgi:hypothetical protein